MKIADREKPQEQLTLFNPPRIRPTWHKLPSEVRREVIRLLASMLRNRQEPNAAEGGKDDE